MSRANVRLKFSMGSVYLYTELEGRELPRNIAAALRRRDHWTNHAFLCRIIFSHMILEKSTSSDGFGICNFLLPSDCPLLEVNLIKQQITIETGHSTLTFGYEEFMDKKNEERIYEVWDG